MGEWGNILSGEEAFVATKGRMELGATGEQVRENVRRLRGGMQLKELSERLTAVGRPIPPLGLRRIELGERRVDVDDLVALAVVFDVPPLVLLLPPDASEVVGSAITGVAYPEIAHDVQWDWALGRRRLFQGEPDEHPDADRIFEAKSLPVVVRGDSPSQLLKDAPEGVDPVEFAREQFHRAMKRGYGWVADTIRAQALARFDEDVL